MSGAPSTALTAAPLLSDDGGSSMLLQVLKILLFTVPMLLVVAALVPASLGVVPARFGLAWHRARLDLAIIGGGILLVEGFVYLLAR